MTSGNQPQKNAFATERRHFPINHSSLSTLPNTSITISEMSISSYEVYELRDRWLSWFSVLLKGACDGQILNCHLQRLPLDRGASKASRSTSDLSVPIVGIGRVEAGPMPGKQTNAPRRNLRVHFASAPKLKRRSGTQLFDVPTFLLRRCRPNQIRQSKIPMRARSREGRGQYSSKSRVRPDLNS